MKSEQAVLPNPCLEEEEEEKFLYNCADSLEFKCSSAHSNLAKQSSC
jgi:hypothetical protein